MYSGKVGNKQGSVKLYINGVLQVAPTTEAGPPLVVSGITLPANGNMVLVYEANVTAFAPLSEGDSIINTATITGGGLSTPVTVNETVTPVAEPLRDITKSISPVPVAENGVVLHPNDHVNRAQSTNDVIPTAAKMTTTKLLRKAIEKMEKDGEMTEDEQKASEKTVQDLTDKFIKEVDAVVSKKEKEIMEL